MNDGFYAQHELCDPSSMLPLTILINYFIKLYLYAFRMLVERQSIFNGGVSMELLKLD